MTEKSKRRERLRNLGADTLTDTQRLFRDNLRAIIARHVKRCKQDGTTAMSADNVWQCIVQEVSRAAGAPLGTNGAYMARQVFDDLVTEAKRNHNSFFI